MIRRYRPKPLKANATLQSIIQMHFWEPLLEKYPLTQDRVVFHKDSGDNYLIRYRLPKGYRSGRWSLATIGAIRLQEDGIRLTLAGDDWPFFPYCDPESIELPVTRIVRAVEHFWAVHRSIFETESGDVLASS